MRHQKRSKKTCGLRTSPAAGVTLTEVLMSLMIMSIGISAVAVLFPISVLRSVQATQMTNAAILKYNAEALVQMMPQVVFDPDGDGNLPEHLRNSTEQHYIVDPTGYFELAASGASYSTYATLSNNNNASLPNDNAQRGLCDWFGSIDTDNDGVPEPLTSIPRYDGGIRAATISGTLPLGYAPAGGNPEETRALQMLASTLSKLGDGWDTAVDSIADGYLEASGNVVSSTTGAVHGVKLPDDLDLTGLASSLTTVPVVSGNQLIPDPEMVRVVVFSFDGRFSVSYPAIEIDSASHVVRWSEQAGQDINKNGTIDSRALPAEFNIGGSYVIGRVLIQTARTKDYNWLLSVRRGSDGQCRGVDVVVTHNKGVTPDDERVFPASFNTATSATSSPFIIRVLSSSGLKLDGVPAEPHLRRSGYVFDVVNCRWYRIRDYQEATVTVGSVTGPGYLVTLEQPVVQNALDGGAMFLPGVVDVFPMGPVTVPINQ
jgi:hypothetical protein